MERYTIVRARFVVSSCWWDGKDVASWQKRRRGDSLTNRVLTTSKRLAQPFVSTKEGAVNNRKRRQENREKTERIVVVLRAGVCCWTWPGRPGVVAWRELFVISWLAAWRQLHTRADYSHSTADSRKVKPVVYCASSVSSYPTHNTRSYSLTDLRPRSTRHVSHVGIDLPLIQ